MHVWVGVICPGPAEGGRDRGEGPHGRTAVSALVSLAHVTRAEADRLREGGKGKEEGVRFKKQAPTSGLGVTMGVLSDASSRQATSSAAQLTGA